MIRFTFLRKETGYERTTDYTTSRFILHAQRTTVIHQGIYVHYTV